MCLKYDNYDNHDNFCVKCSSLLTYLHFSFAISPLQIRSYDWEENGTYTDFGTDLHGSYIGNIYYAAMNPFLQDFLYAWKKQQSKEVGKYALLSTFCNFYGENEL